MADKIISVTLYSKRSFDYAELVKEEHDRIQLKNFRLIGQL
jgi:hypothetical protein